MASVTPFAVFDYFPALRFQFFEALGAVRRRPTKDDWLNLSHRYAPTAEIAREPPKKARSLRNERIGADMFCSSRIA